MSLLDIYIIISIEQCIIIDSIFIEDNHYFLAYIELV